MNTAVTTFSEGPDDPFAVRRSASAVLDGDGRVVGWSERAEALLGHLPEDVLGRPAREVLLDPRDEEVVMAAVAACVSEGAGSGSSPYGTAAANGWSWAAGSGRWCGRTAVSSGWSSARPRSR